VCNSQRQGRESRLTWLQGEREKANFTRLDSLIRHLEKHHHTKVTVADIPERWYAAQWMASPDYLEAVGYRFFCRMPERDHDKKGVTLEEAGKLSLAELKAEMATQTGRRPEIEERRTVTIGPNKPATQMKKSGKPVPLELDAISDAPSSYGDLQSPPATKRRRMDELLKGTAQPPNNRTVVFQKGPEMVDKLEELAADAQRYAGAMKMFADLLKEKNEAWLSLDLERKQALKTHSLEKKKWRADKESLEETLQEEKKKNTTMAYQLAEAEIERDDMDFRLQAEREKVVVLQEALDAANAQVEKCKATITTLQETADCYLEEVTAVRDMAEAGKTL
jgi:hypothetical protein